MGHCRGLLYKFWTLDHMLEPTNLNCKIIRFRLFYFATRFIRKFSDKNEIGVFYLYEFHIVPTNS